MGSVDLSIYSEDGSEEPQEVDQGDKGWDCPSVVVKSETPNHSRDSGGLQAAVTVEKRSSREPEDHGGLQKKPRIQ